MRFKDVLYAALLMACLAATTACEPPPPAPVFTVNDPGVLPDAAPGDGTCEANPGIGDCTLLAAVGEGNAHGRAVVEVTGGQDLQHDLEVTGSLTIRSSDEGRHRLMAAAHLPVVVVASGGSLTLERIELYASLQVHGSANVLDSEVWSLFAPALDVRAGGIAGVNDSVLRTEGGGRAVSNGDTVLIVDTMVGGVYRHVTPSGLHEFQLGGVDTAPGASTFLLDTWLASNAGSACGGDDPISFGGNRAPDTTCNLDGPGDVENEPPFIINPEVTYP